MSSTHFSNLELPKALLDNLETLGYHDMTPVQEQSLPIVLEGKDLIAQAKTGSGKTAAFSLGILSHLEVKRFRVQALVLCPTRELADQVAIEIRRLGRQVHNIKVLTLCGGTPVGPQIGSLEHGAHIIVGTPGRIEDHLKKGRLNLEELKLLVLDEADRMLEMGFQDALDTVVEHSPSQRQTLLFSATFPKQIETIANSIMKQAQRIQVEATHQHASIDQHFYKVEPEQRLETLRRLLLSYQPGSSIVFCNTKIQTQDVADELINMGFNALALHGDLEQRARDQTLVRFANKSASILVATDVAARGLDIDKLDAVFNFEIAHDTEVHVHRIGRTGRAGEKGLACTLFSDRDSYKMALLSDYLGHDIDPSPLPDDSVLRQKVMTAPMMTLQIDGGKRQKLRPGDILGALTGDQGIAGDEVGKIKVLANFAYVAVKRESFKKALACIEQGRMKGKKFRVRVIRG
ncbi:ATP-dependent RNA helicase DbpA [Alginatibacterium sediminis]|uniref:ATP-dependent RNA helicase DbpA n=1 Tax=Alginatibacterium sediminis TaxID=2164068 RepID=A0A420ENE9_9ALTE|nr:ATP-dependent RNA helicase DbpA [Alginatibacterium sediminis]RKF22249.1 ATP-dependent RNA helicase DbpA [Alginatibacterium sediminis]